MRISDWSSDLCSSDLLVEILLDPLHRLGGAAQEMGDGVGIGGLGHDLHPVALQSLQDCRVVALHADHVLLEEFESVDALETGDDLRSEEHTSELKSLMRISYAVFCLKKKTNITNKCTNRETQHQEENI